MKYSMSEAEKNPPLFTCPLCGAGRTPVCFKRLDMTLRRCGACGLMFQGPDSRAFANRGVIDEVYRGYLKGAAAHSGLFKARLARIAELTKSSFAGARVLEIGSGNGSLGDLLVKAGADYTGVEPMAFFREAAAAFPSLAGRIVAEPFRAGKFEPGSFDLVIAADTLEHMADPFAAAAEAARLLKPGGKFYAEVPNEALLELKGSLRVALKLYVRGYPTNPEHAFLFTRKTLSLFLEKAGFTPEKVIQDSVWGSPERLRVAFNGRPPAAVRAASFFFRLTRLDLLLQQGALAAAASVRPG